MSIGRVLNTAFGAIFGNLFVMLGIAFLFSGLPQGLITYLQQTVQAQAIAGLISSSTIVAVAIGGAVLSILLAVVAQGAVVRATMAAAQGERASFGECLETAMRRLLPLLGLGLVSGIAMGFATLLLIVPGIILATIWYVAAPLVVAERSGVFAALGRSAELTKGERWNIFVILLVVVGISIGIFMISSMVSAALIALSLSGGSPAGVASSAIALPMAILSAIVATVNTAITSAIPTAAYVELHALKDEPETKGLDEIFA